MTRTPTQICCREPKPTEWFRVRPGIENVTVTGGVRDPDTGVLHLLHGVLWPLVGHRVEWICPRVCVNRDSRMFLWPVPMPGPEDRWSSWLSAGQAVADLAEMVWIRVEIDSGEKQYRVATLDGRKLPEPTWSTLEYLDLIHATFHGRVINSADHPLIRKWGGM